MARMQKTIQSIFFLLRFLQLAASAITGFIYCYLIWHHTHHFCAYFPDRCLEKQRRNTRVPYQYILITVAGILCFVNILATTLYFIIATEKIVYRVLIFTDGVVLAAYATGLGLVFRVPGSKFWCYYFQTPLDYRANVAERNCVIGQDGKGSLACVVGFTAFVVILAVIKEAKGHCAGRGSAAGGRDWEEGSAALVGDPRRSGGHISVDIDVAAFMSHEQRMVIGIGDATGVAEDEKPVPPTETHPAERVQSVGDMEISEMSRRHGNNLI